MRRFPAKTADPSISQKPRYCWVSAFCDAVVLGRQDPPNPWQKNTGTEALDVLEKIVQGVNVDKVFVFGSRYINQEQNPPQGMHDIHYNQGDPVGPFRHLDGIWHDGGVITRSVDGIYGGYFVKFATQSLNTDNNEIPI